MKGKDLGMLLDDWVGRRRLLIRGEGLTRSLAADAAERFFALGFALEQMRNDCSDLARCVSEWARKPAIKRA